MSAFTDAVEGFDLGDTVRRAGQTASVSATPASRVAGVVIAQLRQLRRLTAHELPFLQAHSPGAIKITLPSATQFPGAGVALEWSRRRGRFNRVGICGFGVAGLYS
jgi:hypothetical protein